MSKSPNADLDFIAETLPIFVSEAQEQIESFEQLMLQLEDQPDDPELLGALFRCAHTVKGSAGVFGLDAVVAFTHHVETLLDRLREGHVALTPALGTLLLQGNDEIRALVGAATALQASEGTDRIAQREALVLRLQQASGLVAAAEPQPKADEPAALAAAGDAAAGWHVSVRFGDDTFRNGMDPGAILNYLRGIGEVRALRCNVQAVPPLDQIDPENCHLAFELELHGDADRASVESAFAFVRDDCELELTPLGDVRAGITPNSASDGAFADEQTEEVANSMGDAARALLAHLEGAAAAVPAASAGSAGAAIPARGTAASAGVAPPKPAGSDENRFIRVHADRLDAVINLLGELVIAGAGATLLARQTRQRGLLEANLQIARLIEEIRNGTLQLRMVPIGETFVRFRRVVRDTAAELGKDVALEITGAEAEMDKAVVERIADPLMHLVRNALDHGLETAADRLAAGKPAQGKLTLAARHESGAIVISIVDDGRGIQRSKVLQRAWDRGLLERGVVPPDDEVLNLIFEPGFSTAEAVTNLSGRGVGMDVVRRNIQALRGSVSLHSVEGQGSRIEIRLPLTLAIIDGFLIGVGNSRFVFPLDAVVEVIEGRDSVSRTDAQGRSVIELRGRPLPVVSLRALYALDGPEPERSSVVVLQQGSGKRFGVRVDQLLGQHQTVIKPLGRLLSSLRGMAGSSILGNGDVALIFDVAELGLLACEASKTVDIPSPARPDLINSHHQHPTQALTAEGTPL